MVDEENLYKDPSKFIALAEKNTFTDDTGTYPSMEHSPRFHKYTLFERLKILLRLSWLNRKYLRFRKKLGSAILGNPKHGKGILINIPLGYMTEDQKKYWWEARRLMQKAGITCDSGSGPSGLLDLEFDWSLHGAIAICKRCGYDSRKHIKEYVSQNIEKHNKNINSSKRSASAYDCQNGKCNCLNDQRGENGF